MVKVEGFSRFEDEVAESNKTIADVVRNLFNEDFPVHRGNIGYHVREGIFFLPGDNKFYVSTQQHFEDAMRLAIAYEEKIGRPVTIKKDYKD